MENSDVKNPEIKKLRKEIDEEKRFDSKIEKLLKKIRNAVLLATALGLGGGYYFLRNWEHQTAKSKVAATEDPRKKINFSFMLYDKGPIVTVNCDDFLHYNQQYESGAAVTGLERVSDVMDKNCRRLILDDNEN